jgi:REP element-mobilizing transposase RayT
MARKHRIHYLGACYHVILRGNAGHDIFFDKKDRSRFFLLLQEGMERYKHRIHAFCLMTNHIHLAIQVGEVPLSRIMQNVSFRYTRYINRRKKQVGHLFQGRYKALLIDADSYLLELVRYIHNNPVRAGLVKTPEEYPWSSHNVYLGNVSIPWLTTDWVLSQFAGQKKRAVALYQDFVLKGKDEAHRKEFYKGNFEGRILGEDRFADEALAKALQKVSRKPTLEQVLQAVCEQYEIHQDDLSSGGSYRRISEPRSVAALLVREIEHLSIMDLSRRLKRDLSGLSQAAIRLDKRLESDPELTEKVNKIKLLIE